MDRDPKAKTLKNLANYIEKKANLKQDVYYNTKSAFDLIKQESMYLLKELRNNMLNKKRIIPLEIIEHTEFEFEIKFAGDILAFFMHTNAFILPPHHQALKNNYAKENKDNTFVGIINIFNFLSDSFKYNRYDDLGFLIGRIYINKDNHFFVEGRPEIQNIPIQFEYQKISSKEMRNILINCILSTLDFDLMAQPLEGLEPIPVGIYLNALESYPLKTSKLVGFKVNGYNK
jgi:hypothetical protein